MHGNDACHHSRSIATTLNAGRCWRRLCKLAHAVGPGRQAKGVFQSSAYATVKKGNVKRIIHTLAVLYVIIMSRNRKMQKRSRAQRHLIEVERRKQQNTLPLR